MTRIAASVACGALLVGSVVGCKSGDTDSAETETATTTAAATTTEQAEKTETSTKETTSKAAKDSDSDGDDASNAGVFPVTIKHRHGETIIKEQPKRVVALGYSDQDALLAAGITPVAVNDWGGMAPEGQAAGNWANDLIEGDYPRIDKNDEVNLEAILADKPDLIVAVYFDMEKDTYDELSKIAPVIVSKADYERYQQPWDVTSIEIGKAVGKEKEMKKRVAEVKKKFETIKDRHPEWEGKTLGVATIYDDKVSVFSPDDPRSRFFSALGFTINPAYEKITGDNFHGEVSKENADKIESDVLVWDQLSYSENEDKTSVTEDEILKTIPAVAENRVVYLEGDLEKAFGWQTILSLDYTLDHIEDLLVEAVGK